jgi:hypothetical protein
MFTRIILFCALLLPASWLQAQEKDTITISDSLVKVETDASFPGGINAWAKFLQANLNASVPVDKGAPAGRYTVEVQFIVDRDGTPTDFKALTTWGYGMEEEVIRVLKKTGSWIPAHQGGRTVKAYRKQPVTFLTQLDDVDITTTTPYTLYSGIDNTVSIIAYNIKPEDLSVTVSKNATIEVAGNGKYNVKVLDTKERVVFTIKDSKKNKIAGQYSIEAKAAPQPKN